MATKLPIIISTADGSSSSAAVAMKSESSLTPVQRLMSSCIGATVTALCVTPLDVVKTRIQAQQKESLMNNNQSSVRQSTTNTRPIGSAGGVGNGRQFGQTFKMFIKMSRTEGLTSLWSGLPPTLAMVIPGMGVYFTSYDLFRVHLNKQFGYINRYQPLWVPIVAGSVARTLAAVIISPLEMIKTKMQSQLFTYGELALALRHMIRVQGYRSLWTGITATILRDAPFSSIYWAVYETMKQHAFGSPVEPTVPVSFICGASAGTVAAIVTHPFDVVKTHRQIEMGSTSGGGAGGVYRTSALLAHIYRETGARGVFTGITPRLMRVAPACAIMISTFELGKTYCRQYNDSKLT
ncbi:probable mitochondrial glutathione transporter SLC25A40 [Oppia nitens]|uniref:probable mitochondrial glutathione transporter SLC25A40 n=1 Tax=Oppia nitens TaxID=1686743 RepID=UPI0023DA6812|nr:probable mitochondrial glutathione transporter SLC25A40 [Oppia nitens]